jgi:CubicO group peptidase (beta-lactamase class C family)
MRFSKIRWGRRPWIVGGLALWDSVTRRFTGRSASVEELDAFVRREVTRHRVPGLAVAVVVDGEVRWSRGYGYADLAQKRRVTPDTPFMLGSVSKVVTGAAVMRLVEQGRLHLDEDVNARLPFAVRSPWTDEPMTLRHLATHTSGILDSNAEYASPYVEGDSPISLRDFLQGYLTPGGRWYDPRGNFASASPGQSFRYSNVGVALSALMVETTAERPFDRFTEEQLFEPLGLTRTHWFLRDFSERDAPATPYDERGRPLAQYGYPTYPDGQLRSSANDLGRILAAFMNGGELGGRRILQARTVRTMLTPQVPAVRNGEDEQLLFWTEKGGLIGHSGGDDGVLTLMYFDPQTRIGAVLLTNQQSEASANADRTIIRRILRDPGTVRLFRAGT